MANFIGMVYGTLNKKGIDTSKMSTEEAIKKFNEIQRQNGNENKESSKNGISKEKQDRILKLKEELKNAKGIFGRAKINNEIKALESGFDNVDDYMKAEKEKREILIKTKNEEFEKEKERLKSKQIERDKENQESEKFKRFKFENKTPEEKDTLLQDLSVKYSKEEFTPLFHGGSKESVNNLKDNIDILSVKEKEEKFGSTSGGNLFGLSTSKDKSGAEIFSKSKNNEEVAEMFLSPDAKIYDLGKNHIDNLSEKEVYDIMQQGYDVIDTSFDNDEKEMRILNSSKIFTKKQMSKHFN